MIFKPGNKKDDKLDKAREFCLEVVNLADKYGLSFFFVTEGASATRNNGCDAVRHAREAQIEWEKKNGADPDEDWLKDKNK